MNTVTLVRFRNAMESKFFHEHPNDWIYPELYIAFKKRFGNQASLKELIPWLKKIDQDYEVDLLSTADGELTRACIENGAKPNVQNNSALLLAAEDGDCGSVSSLNFG